MSDKVVSICLKLSSKNIFYLPMFCWLWENSNFSLIINILDDLEDSNDIDNKSLDEIRKNVLEFSTKVNIIFIKYDKKSHLRYPNYEFGINVFNTLKFIKQNRKLFSINPIIVYTTITTFIMNSFIFTLTLSENSNSILLNSCIHSSNLHTWCNLFNYTNVLDTQKNIQTYLNSYLTLQNICKDKNIKKLDFFFNNKQQISLEDYDTNFNINNINDINDINNIIYVFMPTIKIFYTKKCVEIFLTILKQVYTEKSKLSWIEKYINDNKNINDNKHIYTSNSLHVIKQNNIIDKNESSSKQNIFLITFCTKRYETSAKVLRNSALKHGIDQVIIITSEHEYFKEWLINQKIFNYENLDKTFTLEQIRGAGYWSWQSYIVYKLICSKQLKMSDIVIYCDAGINIINDLNPLIDLCNKFDTLLFNVGEFKQKNYINKAWTKPETFVSMNILNNIDDPRLTNDNNYHLDSNDNNDHMIYSILNSYQVMGGFQWYKKTVKNINFLMEFSNCSLLPENIADKLDENGKNLYTNHRHNQSILSILRLKYNFFAFKDPSQFGIHDKIITRDLKKSYDSSEYPEQFIDIHRKTLKPVPNVTIITPTIGHEFLERCVKSVQAQNYINVTHLLVCDGPLFSEKVMKIYKKFQNKNILQLLNLPFNTGKNNWNGHRIYSSVPHLCHEADYIIFLDEDNYLDPTHVDTMVKLADEKSLDWVFSLRTIIDYSNKFICVDNCESLGTLSPVYNSLNNTVPILNDPNNMNRLIDTSCYMIKRTIAMELSMLWNSPTRIPKELPKGVKKCHEPDREICKYLIKNYPQNDCTNKHSLFYMVGNRSDSVQAQFFIHGNKYMKNYFENLGISILPWIKPKIINDIKYKRIYLFHFTPQATEITLESILKKLNNTERNIGFKQWQITIIEKLVEDCIKNNIEIINGYNTKEFLPNSIILVNACFYETIPIELLLQIKKNKQHEFLSIIYTNESPNVRHQKQWDKSFLVSHFDFILTYWEDLLSHSKNFEYKFEFCPYIQGINCSNDFGMSHLIIPKLIRKPECFLLNEKIIHNPKITMCIVLENRDFNFEYNINNVKLNSLDHLRYKYVKFISSKNIHIKPFGNNWKEFNGIKDPRYTYEIMQDYTFVLIIENTNANGYVSEKIYDAFVAGCIPIYYGNINDRYNIPKETYIDLKLYNTPEKLYEYLYSLSISDIYNYLENVVKYREQILTNASSKVYNEILTKVFKGF
jgi:hypothetical protein